MPTLLSEGLALLRHPGSVHLPVQALRCTLAREADGWRLCYALRGEVGRLALPAVSGVPQQRHGLWRHTCFEAFVARADAAENSGYWEFNFSPSGDWAAYAFERERVRSAAPLVLWQPPRIECMRAADELLINVWLADWSGMTPGRWQWGLSAVVEDNEGGLAYWALHHAKAQPDFHDRAGWRAVMEW